MKFGGMPGILPLKNEESKLAALTDIFNTIIFRDIITRYKIKNSDMFERFTYYLINTTGETFSANSISNFFKNLARKVSKDTILRYASYLVDSFFILKAKRFNLKGKNVLKIYEKYYLTDHGFHQSIVGHDQDAYTNLLENIIYIELLRRGYDVKVGDVVAIIGYLGTLIRPVNWIPWIIFRYKKSIIYNAVTGKIDCREA